MGTAALANRVYETSVTTGAGAFTLAGAATPRHRTFLGALGAAATTFYLIAHRALGEWEAGVGVVNGDGTLTRTTVLKNHLGTTATVSFSAGTKDVFQDVPAEKLVTLDADTNQLTLPGALKLNGISYTFPATQAANRFLKTDGSGNLSWALPTELLALTDLSDVAISGVAAGDVLRYSGSAWVNEPAVSANTASRVVARDANGDFAARLITATLIGLASTATALATPRAINGQAFDGTAAITVPVNNVDDIATAATVYPLWTATVGGNYAAKVSSTKLTFNPSTGVLTASGFAGPLTGNASTATALQTARAINGVNFDGTAAITVTAAAGTLTGATLNATVTGSSLTSVGVLTGLAVGGAADARAMITVAGSRVASSGVAYSALVNQTLVAAANNDELTVLRLAHSASPGSYTGVVAKGLVVSGFSTAAYTSPGDPRGIDVGVVTGTGAGAAYGVFIAAPTGATTNIGLYNAGTSWMLGPVGIGGGSDPSVGLYLRNTSLTTTAQVGVGSYPIFSSAAAGGAGYAVLGRVQTAVASFTLSSGYTFYASAPTIGAGSAITTQYGIQIANQGAPSIANAYGVYIVAQSGASTTNIGLYNAGNTQLMAPLAISAAPASSSVIYIAGVAGLTASGLNGIESSPVFPATTVDGRALLAQVRTTAAAFTMTTGYAVLVASPSIGAGSAITTQRGIYVANQGNVNITNAYGIIIDAQSGSGTNIGLYNVGTTRLDSALAFGAAPLASKGLHMASSFNVTAASGIAYGMQVGPTLVAAANGDGMYSLVVNSASTPGAYTSLLRRGIVVTAFSVAAFTTPADPAGILVDVITGTGATNAYAIQLAPPTGATNNYLIAHTTPTTFNVKADGSVRVASLGINGAPTATSKLNITGLPTSAAGLAAGDVWNNAGVLTIA